MVGPVSCWVSVHLRDSADWESAWWSNSAKYREVTEREEMYSESTGVLVNLSAWQRCNAYGQDKSRLTPGQVSGCLWVARQKSRLKSQYDRLHTIFWCLSDSLRRHCFCNITIIAAKHATSILCNGGVNHFISERFLCWIFNKFARMS